MNRYDGRVEGGGLRREGLDKVEKKVIGNLN